MHETALMQGMLRLATEQLAPYRVAQVNELQVQVGRMANVLPDALTMAFESLAQGVFAGARLTLVEAPIVARCQGCGCEYEARRLPLSCPDCGGHGVEILSGTEVYLQNIDFDEIEE